HRQTKEAATDMLGLKSPRHSDSTLQRTSVTSAVPRYRVKSGHECVCTKTQFDCVAPRARPVFGRADLLLRSQRYALVHNLRSHKEDPTREGLPLTPFFTRPPCEVQRPIVSFY